MRVNLAAFSVLIIQEICKYVGHLWSTSALAENVAAFEPRGEGFSYNLLSMVRHEDPNGPPS